MRRHVLPGEYRQPFWILVGDDLSVTSGHLEGFAWRKAEVDTPVHDGPSHANAVLVLIQASTFCRGQRVALVDRIVPSLVLAPLKIE
jgi:hypothetical protein